MSSPAINGVAAAVGVLSHQLYFKRGEHHMYGIRYLQAFFILNGLSIYALSSFGARPVDVALKITFSAAACYLTGVYSSLLLYRAFFHPLRNIPGPFLARLSSFWYTTQVLNADAPEKLLKLHEKYGPFLRIASNEVSIIHPDGPGKIYGLGTKCVKGHWYDQDYPLTSMHTSRNRSMHDQRRKIWSPAFSDKALRGYEQRMKPYEEKLVQQIRAFGNQPVDVTEWFNYFSYDVMGDLAFGESFDMLEKGEEHWAIKLLNEGMEPLHLMLPTWFFRMLTSIPSLTKGYWQFINYCSQQVDKRMDVSVLRACFTSMLTFPENHRHSRHHVFFG